VRPATKEEIDKGIKKNGERQELSLRLDDYRPGRRHFGRQIPCRFKEAFKYVQAFLSATKKNLGESDTDI